MNVPCTIMHHDILARYLLNGADDVVKYEKWWNVKDHEEGERYVTVGRPGYVPAWSELVFPVLSLCLRDSSHNVTLPCTCNRSHCF